MAYSGDAFPEWKGNLFASGLSSRAILRIELDGESATEAERFEMGARIRNVTQGPDGNLWVLEDERRDIADLVRTELEQALAVLPPTRSPSSP